MTRGGGVKISSLQLYHCFLYQCASPLLMCLCSRPHAPLLTHCHMMIQHIHNLHITSEKKQSKHKTKQTKQQHCTGGFFSPTPVTSLDLDCLMYLLFSRQTCTGTLGVARRMHYKHGGSDILAQTCSQPQTC